MKEIELILVLVVITLLIFTNLPGVECATKKKSLFKDRSGAHGNRENFHSSKPSNIDGPELTDEEIREGIKLGVGEGEEDIITFTSDEDKIRKIEKLKKLREIDGMNKELSELERSELRTEERKLRKNVMKASLHFGDFSKEKATAMHALGRNLFKQGHYSHIYTLAWDILAIHEKLDGPDSMEYHRAITNVASTAWKIGEREPARILSRRQLGILQERGEDEGGKEIMMIRARLLSYQDPNGKEVAGLSHEEFKIAIKDYELASDIPERKFQDNLKDKGGSNKGEL